MGKASSSKKVARAARAGSTSKGPERRELGFPLAIALTVLLGSALVLSARSDGSAAVEPKLGTAWYAAYGVYNCDKWEAPVTAPESDPHGISTKTETNTATGGVIDIAPLDDDAAGTKATLGVFFDTIGAKVSNDKIELPNGVVLAKDATCGDKPGVLQVVRYDAADSTKDGEVITKDFSKIRFRKDREAFAIALVAEGTVAPRLTQETLDKLDAVVNGTDTASGATGDTGASGTGASGSGASGTGASGTGVSGSGTSGAVTTTTAP